MPDVSNTPLPPPKPAPRPLQGIAWMIVTGLLFVGVTAIVKHGAQELPAAQSAFLRYFLGLIFLLPMIKSMFAVKLTARQLKLFSLRGFFHSFGVICWFYAMTRISIAEVTAMNFMAPVYITIGAAFFLGERLAIRRVLAVLAAFIGALIVLRPGIREVTDGHLAMVFAAVFFAISYLTAKRMSDEVPATVVVGMLSLIVTICLVPFAAAVWETPTSTEIGWIFLVACVATAGHYTMTLGFAAAPIGMTQPVTFLQLVWSVGIGAMFFDEALDIWVIFGGLVIISATTFIAIREAMLRRSKSSEAA